MLSIYVNLIIFLIVSSFFVLFLSQKKKFFLDIKDKQHKKFVTKTKNYSIGGIILLIFFIYFHFFISKLQNIHILFFGLIFLAGFFSDFKLLDDPKKRFLMQAILLFTFIYLVDLKIPLTKITFIDHYLQNIYFNRFFTMFCLMIFINGSNFIDGINTLLIGHNILICLFLVLFFEPILPNILIIKCLLLALLVTLIFNFSGTIILGDSGSYLISFFMGIYLINFSNSTNSISPFFTILLLWYPCFELLFSMIRRLIFKQKMYEPDTNHLHQILFKFFTKKIKNQNNNHLTVSMLINGYTFLILYVTINMDTYLKVSHILLAILMNLTVYILCYFFLKKALRYQ